ncbi:MAG TPA: hypothetical protein VKH62_02635, partial [Candidatus Binatia bacterium]|nr:hypothetical protein [Candidatus Binatia bacterium]
EKTNSDTVSIGRSLTFVNPLLIVQRFAPLAFPLVSGSLQFDMSLVSAKIRPFFLELSSSPILIKLAVARFGHRLTPQMTACYVLCRLEIVRSNSLRGFNHA